MAVDVDIDFIVDVDVGVEVHVDVNVDLDGANCKISVFFSNDVIANAFEEIYFLSSYNHWEIYYVSLQVHL